MNEYTGISLLSAIIWAVVSGLIGVGIGVTAMCAFYRAKKGDERVNYTPRRLIENFYDPDGKKEVAYLSDLAKGKSAKENMNA